MSWFQIGMLSAVTFLLGYYARPALRWWQWRKQRRFDAMTSAERFKAGWDNIRENFFVGNERWIRVNDKPLTEEERNDIDNRRQAWAIAQLMTPHPDGVTDYAPMTPEQRRAWLNDPNHIVLHDQEADRDEE